jgi:hypothetical protein
MKKFLCLIAFIMIGVVAMGQNSLRTEGNSLITIIPSGIAATSGTYILPTIQGIADWSVQIIPLAGGALTPDSVYATVKIFQSNSSTATTTIWSEVRSKVIATVPASGIFGVTVGHYYPLRDTIANTTVALTPGLIMEGSAFKGSRIKVHVDRPASTDSVNYRVYYVVKYGQSNPQR